VCKLLDVRGAFRVTSHAMGGPASSNATSIATPETRDGESMPLQYRSRTE